MKVRTIFMAILVTCLSAMSEPQSRRSPGTISGRIDAIYFDDANHGYVRSCCRNKQTVYETGDGGLTWRTSDHAVRGLRRGRVFINPSVGWSVVEDRRSLDLLSASDDGGKTWRPVLRSSTRANFFFDAIQAVSESEVWALGLESFHTVDRGNTWHKSEPVGYASVFFLNPQNGWTLGGGVWKTIDGGKHWTKYSMPPSVTNRKFEYLLTDIYFLDRDDGWIVGGVTEENLPNGKQHGVLLSSRDGGATWTVSAELENEYPWSVFFLNDKTGWIGGTNGALLKTTDGGITWSNLMAQSRAAE